MRPTVLSRGLSSLLALTLAACFAPSARAAAEPKTIEYIDGVPDTGQFLPNSAILARVANRKISVFSFRDFYFLSNPEIRPAGDSLGRAEFLTNMIRKEVLGLTALSSGIPLNFEDRSQLREERTTLLSNRLFELNVLNLPPVPEDSLRRIYAYEGYEQRLRVIHFTDRALAEASRKALMRDTSAWVATSLRYNPPSLQQGFGEIGWVKFENVPIAIALQLWRVAPGGFSPVLPAPAGYQVFQVLERRTRPQAEFRIMRPAIEGLVREYAMELRRTALMDEAKKGMHVRYDTTNAAWASKLFSQAVTIGREAAGQTVHIDENVPEFSPADTARTISEWDGGRISLGELTHAYSDIPVVLRPVINTPELLMGYADAIMLAPRMLELAIARGLEKDSVFLAKVERKREQILVGKMVEDSVFSRIYVTRQERLDYYQKNRNGFLTFPSVDYAVIVRSSKAGADSVAARLVAGETVAAILHADSLEKNFRTGTRHATTAEHVPYSKVLFEEMRPGDHRVLGPDRQGDWACVVLLNFDPGRQMPYKEVETLVDESVRNIKGEQALNAFVDRLKHRYPIEAHYDLLMKVKLVTPRDGESEAN
ncbi:MAG: peptidyl-prolyl cis-trans isomerase [Candidatus Eisenbacteria bacterium]|nr:peptidyl-prolyl cis-trans isomerase [Candidatus Eisenbacteria bacterium]